MKGIIKNLGTMAVCAVGWSAGCWLWDEVLNEKVEKMRKKLK